MRAQRAMGEQNLRERLSRVEAELSGRRRLVPPTVGGDAPGDADAGADRHLTAEPGVPARAHRGGQGGAGPARPRARGRRERTVRPRELRRAAGDDRGVRALRAREGRLHRRQAGSSGTGGGGQRRHALPRRGGRAAAVAAGQAAHLPRLGAVPPAGEQQRGEQHRPGRGGHQPKSGSWRFARAASARTCGSGSASSPSTSPPAGPPARTSCPWPSSSWTSWARSWAARASAWASTPARGWKTTPSPGTCAS